MANENKGSKGGTLWGILAGVAAVALVAIGAAIWLRPVAEPVVTEAPAATEAAAAESTPAEETSEEMPVEVVAPKFDTVRIEADGMTVIGGRGEAGQDVALLVDGTEVARTPVGADGTFAMILNVPPSDAAQVLSLVSDPDGEAVAAAETVLVAATSTVPPEATEVASNEEEPAAEAEAAASATEVAAEEAVTEPEPAATEAVSTETAEAAAQAEEPTAETASAETAAVSEPAAPQVLIANAEGVRVLQAGAPVSGVVLDSITYDANGLVVLAGRAVAGNTVRIYLDNVQHADAAVSDEGGWQQPLDVEPGVYTLRLDELDAAGTVVSRMETVIKREDQATIAAAMADQTNASGFSVAVRTVQPGNTLWAIAREQYGRGILYVHVFDANRDLIRNPDLIYPGQVFVLPTLSDDEKTRSY